MNQKIYDIAVQLQAAYPADEAESLAWWILEEETGLSRSQLICECKDTTFSPHTQEIVSRLLHFEPIQYIFGHTLWCGLDLKVTPATLIPRPETAELVETIDRIAERAKTASLKDKRLIRVLDIGTGSGCIAIALKKTHPEWKVIGMDISAGAIEVARENARRNGAEVDFQIADIFADSVDFNGENTQLQITNHPYDIVVSNPPYICEKEKSGMRPNVLDYEPHTALFVPDHNPLLFYRRIASLHAGSHLFFEINEAYPAELAAMLTELDYTDIHITHDIYGKPRIIQARSTR